MPLYDPEKAPLCPAGHGRMVERKGKFGPFFGCRTYPTCSETVDLEDFDHRNF